MGPDRTLPADRPPAAVLAPARERIVDTALALVEANGAAGLSMRRLAAELGVAPTTIYWHVGDRDAVLDAVIDRIGSGRRPLAPAGATPADRIVSIARQLRREARAHPALVSLAQQRRCWPATSPSVSSAVGREVDLAGLRGAPAARAVAIILDAIAGQLLLDTARPRPTAVERSDELVRVLVRGLLP